MKKSNYPIIARSLVLAGTAILFTLIAASAHAQTASSSQVYVLSQVQPENWYKTFNQKIITRASGQVAAFIVTASTSASGYYLGTFPAAGSSQTSSNGLATATSTVSYLKTILVPDGKYYVKIIALQSGSSVKSSGLIGLIGTTPLPTSGASAISKSKVTVSMPPPYIIVTSPISNVLWQKDSPHVVTWITDFKRSNTPNSPYVDVALTAPYGIGPANATVVSSNASSTPALFLGPQSTSGNSQLSLPTLPGLPSVSVPSPSSLPTPSSPFGLPTPFSVFSDINNAIFGKPKPFAVSVDMNAVAYNATGTTHWGKAYPIAMPDNYLETGQAPIAFHGMPSGQYVIQVYVQLANASTRKIETIIGRSSPITVK